VLVAALGGDDPLDDEVDVVDRNPVAGNERPIRLVRDRDGRRRKGGGPPGCDSDRSGRLACLGYVHRRAICIDGSGTQPETPCERAPGPSGVTV
jgi:hypothetical protein